MTVAQRKRVKRKKRFKRNAKRMLRCILFAPGKLPKIRLQTLEQIIRACEVSGILFVISLLTYLLKPDQINMMLSVVSAAVFFTQLLVIKLGHYQEVLERQEYLEY